MIIIKSFWSWVKSDQQARKDIPQLYEICSSNNYNEDQKRKEVDNFIRKHIERYQIYKILLEGQIEYLNRFKVQESKISIKK